MEAIGLTGGIGAGKSLVARILKIMGYPVYVSDREASRLMDTHPGIRQDIIYRFGESVYTKDWHINKPVLADIIFKGPAGTCGYEYNCASARNGRFPAME